MSVGAIEDDLLKANISGHGTIQQLWSGQKGKGGRHGFLRGRALFVFVKESIAWDRARCRRRSAGRDKGRHRDRREEKQKGLEHDDGDDDRKMLEG